MRTILQARDIRFAYGTREVLRGIRVELGEGELVALLGPNGSGKSTLIKALLGHLDPHGAIAWDSREVRQWKRRDLARVVSYLPQNPRGEGTVAEVLRVGRGPYWGAFGVESPRDVEVVRDVARRLGIDEEMLHRPVEQLSGGQRQMVFLGRCLVQEPRAMLLDEPSTFLDLKHQVELLQLLRSLTKERKIGVLMASHDLNLAGAFADRLILLENGQVAADGKPEDVLKADILTRVYGVGIDVEGGRVFAKV